MNTYSLLN